MTERSLLVAIGGNALIRDDQRGTIAEQAENARDTARPIAALVAAGWRVVVTHGNGPQVGFILLRSELAGDSAPVPQLSLDMCGADSQGGIGHILGTALAGELARLGVRDRVVCLLTHTVVAEHDPAFGRPSKPIGPWFGQAQAVAKQRAGWTMVEEAGRGFRRVVASPRPLRIVETPQIQTLFDAGYVVIAAGGGGIPVIRFGGALHGVEAVIDKDRTSALLALGLGADILAISTDVDFVYLDYKRPTQLALTRVTVAELEAYYEAGHFPPGNMGPKVESVLRFLRGGGKEAVITSCNRLSDAIAGRAGTRVVPGAVATAEMQPCEVHVGAQ